MLTETSQFNPNLRTDIDRMSLTRALGSGSFYSTAISTLPERYDLKAYDLTKRIATEWEQAFPGLYSITIGCFCNLEAMYQYFIQDPKDRSRAPLLLNAGKHFGGLVDAVSPLIYVEEPSDVSLLRQFIQLRTSASTSNAILAQPVVEEI